MSDMIAKVRMWGRTIAGVSVDPARGRIAFAYDEEFARSGIQVAPLKMPLGPDIFTFPELNPETFKGLPGMLADSLPDKFGNALINAWLSHQGRSADSVSAVERLCFMGSRGMGALEYEPARSEIAHRDTALEVETLSRLASELMSEREAFSARLPRGGKDDEAFRQLLSVGTSAGGARSKAIVAWNRSTDEFRSGQVAPAKGFEPWIIKLDGEGDAKGYGRIEHAYHRMAVAAGIAMSECRLHLEGGRAHFMTRRFDRTLGGDKLHMQTLGALAHFDFNSPKAYGYEQAFDVVRALGLGADTAAELFRRMAFNIVARNQDDHVKNISFLMDKSGAWSLSPAYDITFNQGAGPTSSHQMTLNLKSDGFELSDFKACAKVVGLKRGQAEAILEQVTAAVRRWPEFADADDVDAAKARRIQQSHRLLIG